MITKHRYLDRYPISPDSEKLIVGTIHPHNHERFVVDFFYGNRITLWNLLSEAFPDELEQPTELDSILKFLKGRKISMSDTIKECTRRNPTALDKDLIPTVLNTNLKEQIRNSKITHVLFTSGFQKNNAFKLFYQDILGLKIGKAIREDREMVLDRNVFGRPIKLTVLYSPSGSSNVPLSKSKSYLSNKLKYRHSHRPVYDFKIDYYRANFASL